MHGLLRSCCAQVEKRCVSLLRSDCSNRPVRAVKTVRATMDSMEPLLRTLPNFRVIHLIRDPRAVALSRIEFDASARGQFTNKVLDSTNSTLCLLLPVETTAVLFSALSLSFFSLC